jgi:hypothetical protein
MISDILSALIKRASSLDEEIDDLEEIVRQRTADRDRILCDDIPTVLHENGLMSAPLEDGRTVSIEQVLTHTVVSKANLFKWLTENDYDQVIRTELSFTKGTPMQEIELSLVKMGVEYEKDTTVHPMSLKSVLRAHMDAGCEPPPIDVVRMNIFERAKIKEAK